MSTHPSPVRRRRTTTALVAAALLLTGLTACGGNDSTASDDPTSTEQDGTTTAGDGTTTTADDEAPDNTEPDESGDACDIVSDEVVKEVLGFDDIPRREASEVPGQSEGCIKGSERTDDLSTASYVSVSFITGGSIIVDQFAAEADAVPVDGLGDKAVFVPSAGSLSIAVGADSFQIQVVKDGRPSDQADATTVGKDVVGS